MTLNVVSNPLHENNVFRTSNCVGATKNGVNSCEFSCEGFGQFLCVQHFAEDCEECQKITKRFRSTALKLESDTSECSSL